MQNRPFIDGDSGDGKNIMKNSSYSKAKVLTLIPIIVLAVIVLCMVLAAILEVPTSRGALYTILALAGLMGVFIAPLPGDGHFGNDVCCESRKGRRFRGPVILRDGHH